jgi:hypothetical protein
MFKSKRSAVMNEEMDKPNTETDSHEEDAPKPTTEVLSDYQKKMKAERARRFGADRESPKP